MPALPNAEGSDHFKFTQGLSAQQQQQSCILGWLNNNHYTMTVPMQEIVQLRSELELKTVLFHYDAPLALDAVTAATNFNQDVNFSNVHAKNWVAQDTMGHGDCLPYTLAACALRLKALFLQFGWPWREDVPLTALAWRKYLCNYVRDNKHVYEMLTGWHSDDDGHAQFTRDRVKINVDHVLDNEDTGWTRPGSWMSLPMLHVAAGLFETLKLPGLTFSDGREATVRLFKAEQSSVAGPSHAFRYLPPSAAHTWETPLRE